MNKKQLKSKFDFLWYEYVECDKKELSKDAIELRNRLINELRDMLDTVTILGFNEEEKR